MGKNKNNNGWVGSAEGNDSGDEAVEITAPLISSDDSDDSDYIINVKNSVRELTPSIFKLLIVVKNSPRADKRVIHDAIFSTTQDEYYRLN